MSEMQFGTEPNHLFRHDAPDTSVDAAFAVDTTHLEKVVYNVIEKAGADGCISDDVRAELSHLPYSSVTARFRALLDKGYIVDSGRTQKGNTGRSQRVLVATPHWLGGGNG